MLVPEQMSPTERNFIRAYVVALRRDFHLVMSVMRLMNPAGLDVKDPLVAVRTAVALQHMHADFEAKLRGIKALKGFSKKVSPDGPTLDELSELFSFSFFKVFTTDHAKFMAKQQKDAGWFSGSPDQWHQMFKHVEATKKLSAKNKSGMFNMFGKLMSKLSLFKNYGQDEQIEEDLPMNFWPLKKPDKSNDYNVDDFFDDDYEDN